VTIGALQTVKEQEVKSQQILKAALK